MMMATGTVSAPSVLRWKEKSPTRTVTATPSNGTPDNTPRKPRRNTMPVLLEPVTAPWHERLFAVIMPLIVGLFIAAGLYMTTVQPEIEQIAARVRRLKTQFVIREPEKKIKPKPKPSKPLDKPVDLTDKPKLAQKIDDKPKAEPRKKQVLKMW